MAAAVMTPAITADAAAAALAAASILLLSVRPVRPWRLPAAAAHSLPSDDYSDVQRTHPRSVGLPLAATAAVAAAATPTTTTTTVTWHLRSICHLALGVDHLLPGLGELRLVMVVVVIVMMMILVVVVVVMVAMATCSSLDPACKV